MTNRILILSLSLLLLLYTTAIIMYFNHNLRNVYRQYNIEEDKKIIKLALNYHKQIFEQTKDTEKKEQLIREYKFINSRQAYIWLLDKFTSRLKNETIFMLSAVSILLLVIILAIYYLFLKTYVSP